MYSPSLITHHSPLITQHASPGLAEVPFAVPLRTPEEPSAASAVRGTRQSWAPFAFHRIHRGDSLAAAAAGLDMRAPFAAGLHMSAPLSAALDRPAPFAVAQGTQLVTAVQHARRGVNAGQHSGGQGCMLDSRQ